jgi:hypothetical protein
MTDRTIGLPRFASVNSLIAARATAVTPLIVAHRGTGLGSIPENTTGAVTVAVRQGADIVEVDTVRSTDGDFFVFHDGYEGMHFGISKPLTELSTEQIRQLRYRWVAVGSGQPSVTPLAELLAEKSDVMLNVDRSWRYWPDIFTVLDAHTDPSRILLKCPPEDPYLRHLADHDVPYPLIPRVTEPQQVDEVLKYHDVNVVGFELIAPTADSPFLDAGYIAELHSMNLLVFVNALSFGPELVQFGGYDDEISVLGDPADGWGRLIALGVDIIQTDWPDLLRGYRSGVGA